eukprot:gene5633-6329_t
MSASIARLKIFRNGCRHEAGKMVLFPKTIEELLDVSKQKLGIDAVKIFSMDGAEVDDIALLRDDESVFVSAGEAFIDPSSNVGSVVPCYSQKIAEPTAASLNDEWVTLNVGGTRFVTTRTTLTKDPNSMLARMFSTQDCTWHSRVDGQGAYLIDRSPVYFEPILNYLRQGSIILNTNTADLKGLLEEAKFFGLGKLVEELEHKIQGIRTSIFPMARAEFVRILLSTPSICELRCQGVDLHGADLSNLDLRYINFKLANLVGCNLSGANLGNACLERAELTNACLDEANLSNIKMSRANLEGASLIKCNFEDPTGHKANLEGANLKGALLEGSQMTGINLRLANLKGANMQNSVLHDAMLAGADLENCNLTGCDLQGANLRGANVVGTVFLNLTTPLHMVHLINNNIYVRDLEKKMASYKVEDLFHINRWILRINNTILGMVTFSKRSEINLSTKSKILVSNSLSPLDSLVLESIESHMLVSKNGSLPFLISWLMGHKYSDNSARNSSSTLKDHFSTTDVDFPALIFPEESPTNGQKSMLKFRNLYFQFNYIYQPIVLTARRPAFLPIRLNILNGGFWSDLLWTFFVPYTIYDICYLHPMEKLDSSTDDAFAKSICKEMCDALKLEPTHYDVSDKKELIKRLQHTQNAQQRSQPSMRPSNSRLDIMVRQVKDVLPQVPSDVIKRDLVKSKSVDTTLTSLLEGRIMYIPLSTEELEAEKKQQRTAQAIKKSKDSMKSKNQTGLSFKEKKRFMIEEARSKYLEKHPEFA